MLPKIKQLQANIDAVTELAIQSGPVSLVMRGEER